MMHPVLVLHGPNLNLLGNREPEVYGTLSLAEIDDRLLAYGEKIGLEVRTAQHNGEGAMIDALHDAMGWAVGVVLNPGGYTHTSIALRDATSSEPSSGTSTPLTQKRSLRHPRCCRKSTVTPGAEPTIHARMDEGHRISTSAAWSRQAAGTAVPSRGHAISLSAFRQSPPAGCAAA